MSCTGVSASWCPVHGDCTCERTPDGECCFDNTDCPLHSMGSEHADTVDLASIEQRISVIADNEGVDLSENDRAEVARFAQFLYERSRKPKSASS